MQRIKSIVAGAVGIWLFSVVMIFVFPRQQYPELSAVFAVLFWISLITACILSYLLIRNSKKRKRQVLWLNSQNKHKTAGHAESDIHSKKRNPQEVKK